MPDRENSFDVCVIGAGTHQAVDSGFSVAALVEQDLAP
jgi:hypothetical protein